MVPMRRYVRIFWTLSISSKSQRGHEHKMPPLAFTTYSILLRLFFIILVVCYNLRTSYLVLQTQTFLDFYVHTIA